MVLINIELKSLIVDYVDIGSTWKNMLLTYISKITKKPWRICFYKEYLIDVLRIIQIAYVKTKKYTRGNMTFFVVSINKLMN